jgi:NADH:ubiquinone oxidoreductase subunit F (NADH-binding)/(2Fe-2S) ferredoxin/NAD-dependent dihydropyrimidine dehydrogenase PreA subunit
MSKPTESVSKLRKQAIRRLFEQKFLAPVRITVGSATCENAAGADAVYARFQELMAQHQPKGVVVGRVGCAGKCDMEPLVTVIARNGIPTKYIMMDAERATRVFESHILKGAPVPELSMRQVAGGLNAERVVSLCGGGACPKQAADGVRKAFREALERQGLKDKVLLTESPCQGLCDNGPTAYVYPEGVMYEKLDAARVERITQEHLLHGKPVAEYAWDSDRISNRFFPLFGDIHFFGNQLRLTLRNCGVIDPESLDEYLAVRGYEASARVLESMTAAQVVNAMKQSGLRGRGGGGFPTGLKWQMALDQPGPEKYIICNADEGDPGAFMDRSTIEGDPHTILEGMIIGGYAIGATKGFIYIRAEYPLAIKRLEKAIDDARRAGFLGRNVFGSNFNFDIEIRLGAGAFVCGEETALINSIEGRRGMPRPRPPYPTVSGLWGKPTVINNVETFANVPVIILDGPAWFGSIGTPKSKGTKVFALAGDVANTGLIEVPMGTTLREVVYGVGGGIKDGKRLKAVQTGGPAGGCMPESALDTPIDYDSLAAAGSIMGSGGMIVMDEDNCMVNVARFFIEFTQDESCGKCTPCREGTKRMLEILTRITEGKGVEGDVEKLLRLADTVKRSSLCGLGQAAPNPVLSTIRHFRAEYDAHIRDKHCATGACRTLVRYLILPDKCVGCGACKRNCPVECITGEVRKPHTIDQDQCVKCGRCFDVCKFDAVKRN